MKETIEITLNLISNAFVFFSFIFFYVMSRPFQKHKIINNILSGLIVGLLTIYLMFNPWNFAEGYFFDARSIVILVSALFFGFFPTLIASVIAVAYRIIIGGTGVYPGVITVIVSFIIGYYWPKIRKPFAKWGIYLEYLFLGLIVHVLVLLGFFSVPYPQSLETIRKAFIPFLAVYPVITMGLSVILYYQKEGFLKNTMIIQQQTLLQSSIDSTPMMEIFSVDQNYNYMSMNMYHKKQMKKFYSSEPAIGDNYVNFIADENMKNRVIELINSALTGKVIKKTIEVEVEKGKFLEEYYTPIKNSDGSIIGVSIFSEDITEKYNYEQNVLKLSYRDPLTNLYNRRHYEEELLRLNQEKYYPLSIVFADINGLKIMNDVFGHNAGDELLVAVAKEFIKTFYSEKNVSRIGGDEFAILLANTPKESALMLLEKAKENLLNQQINGMNISVAFGLATKSYKENIADVIKEAENDMYVNKLFEISSHRNETIKTIMQTLQEKNPREEAHSKRVSLICKTIGKKLKMSANDLRLLDAISSLHDIGKITIDERILNKPGKLDKEEWEVIKKHPEVGYRILSASQEYAIVAEDILSHHERYDGTGYPRGLKGEEIPIRARIIALADSYDAMTSHRPYRDALSHQQAIMEIKRCSETQFDPKIVKVFLELYENQTQTIKTL